MQQNIGKLTLRLTFGFIMLASHGSSKLMNFTSMMNNFPDPIGLGNSLSLGMAIFAEVLCALLITLGLFTRLATIPLVVTMLVATFIVHAGQPWMKMELAVIYLLGYLAILFIGPGTLSLDYILRKRS
jgi:putative oxidoreductase